MPRYFFNIYDQGRDEDDEGIELAGPAEARVQAAIFAGDLLSDDPGLIQEKDLMIEVRDEAGAVLLTVTTSAEEPGEGRD